MPAAFALHPRAGLTTMQPMKAKKARQTVSLKDLDKYRKLALDAGASQARIIDARSIKTAWWVRQKCQYGCGGWGSSHCCPPSTPKPKETARVLEDYRHALLFAYRFQGEGSSQKTSRQRRDFLLALERTCFLDGHHKAFAYSCGPCGLCADCDTSVPCKKQKRARPSMEACGIDVFATARANGIDMQVVRDEEDDYTFCYLLLID